MDTYFDDRSLDEIESDLVTFWEHLSNKAPTTKITKIAIIKMFMRYYNKETRDFDIWNTFKSRLRGKNHPVSKEHVPDKNEIKNILNQCNCMIRTAVVMSVSSGLRIGEVVGLEPYDVFENENPVRINVRAEVAKTKVRRTTFISKEAADLLKEWFRIRDDYIKHSLKSLNFNYMEHLKTERINNKHIFPCDDQVIRRGFNKACDKCGYTDKTIMNGDDSRNTKRSRRSLRFHNLRKFFRSNFGKADLAHHLMGHEGYMTMYRQFSDKRLSEEYLKYEHNVSIYSVSPNQKEMKEKDERIKTLEEKQKEMEKNQKVTMELIKKLESKQKQK